MPLACCDRTNSYNNLPQTESQTTATKAIQYKQEGLSPTTIVITSLFIAAVVASASYCCHHFEWGTTAMVTIPAAGGGALLLYIAIASATSRKVPLADTSTGIPTPTPPQVLNPSVPEREGQSNQPPVNTATANTNPPGQENGNNPATATAAPNTATPGSQPVPTSAMPANNPINTNSNGTTGAAATNTTPPENEADRVRAESSVPPPNAHKNLPPPPPPEQQQQTAADAVKPPEQSPPATTTTATATEPPATPAQPTAPSATDLAKALNNLKPAAQPSDQPKPEAVIKAWNDADNFEAFTKAVEGLEKLPLPTLEALLKDVLAKKGENQAKVDALIAKLVPLLKTDQNMRMVSHAITSKNEQAADALVKAFVTYLSTKITQPKALSEMAKKALNTVYVVGGSETGVRMTLLDHAEQSTMPILIETLKANGAVQRQELVRQGLLMNYNKSSNFPEFERNVNEGLGDKALSIGAKNANAGFMLFMKDLILTNDEYAKLRRATFNSLVPQMTAAKVIELVKFAVTNEKDTIGAIIVNAANPAFVAEANKKSSTQPLTLLDEIPTTLEALKTALQNKGCVSGIQPATSPAKGGNSPNKRQAAKK